jgi:hypothetical protein
VFIRETADERGGESLEEGEERAQGATEEDNVIAGVDGFGKGVFVSV